MSSTIMERLTVPGTRRSTAWVVPAVVLVLVVATSIYVGSVPLDSSETRSLAPEVIFTSLWQHIQLVVVSTVLTIAIGVPLGVLLTRSRTKGLGAVVLAAANARKAAGESVLNLCAGEPSSGRAKI